MTPEGGGGKPRCGSTSQALTLQPEASMCRAGGPLSAALSEQAFGSIARAPDPVRYHRDSLFLHANITMVMSAFARISFRP